MINGGGERLWRPLRNPASVEISAFADENPRGFGLIQRFRDFEHYQDAEAHYEQRPSAWVEPRGDWGRGAVMLDELPTRGRVHRQHRRLLAAGGAAARRARSTASPTG